MTPEEITELKRLAEASVEGAGWEPWFEVEDIGVYACMERFDAEYIAAADPATILRLIAHVEEITEDYERAREWADHWEAAAREAQARIDRALGR